MPAINVVLYQEQPGVSPVVDWLRTLNATNLKPSISAARLLPDSHSSVTNFADLNPTTCATIFMSGAFDWDQSITASFIFFTGAPFQSSHMA